HSTYLLHFHQPLLIHSHKSYGNDLINPHGVVLGGDADVVGGEAVHVAVLDVVLKEYLAVGAKVVFIELTTLLVGQDMKHLGTIGADVVGQDVGHGRGQGVVAFGIGEHVKIADVEFVQETISLEEV